MKKAKNIHKIIALILALLFCTSLFFIACGDTEGDNDVVYSLNFHLRGGTIISTGIGGTEEVFTGEIWEDEYWEGEFFLFKTPIRTHYKFGGWFSSPPNEAGEFSGSRRLSLSTQVNPPTDYYARWIPIEYSTAFNISDERVKPLTDIKMPTFSVETTTNIQLPLGEVKDEYKDYCVFAGWYDNPDFLGSPYTQITDPENGKNRTFYPKVDYSVYSVTLRLNGGNLDSADQEEWTGGVKTYNYDTETFNLPVPVRDNSRFDGWFVTSDFLSGDPVTKIENNSYGNKTLYAKWTLNQYLLEFELNGGSWGVTTVPPTHYTAEDDSLPSPRRAGYRFSGWYTKSDFSGDRVTSLIGRTDNPLKLYAKWTATAFSIEYKLGGSDFPDNMMPSDFLQGYNPGDAFALPVPNNPGYNFIGWYLSPDFSGEKVTNIIATDTGNKVLYANMPTVGFLVEFDTMDSESIYKAEIKNPAAFITDYHSGNAVTLPTASDIARRGFVLDGWYLDSEFSGSRVLQISASDIGSKIFYAKWTAIIYQVTLNLNGGDQTIHPLQFNVTINSIKTNITDWAPAFAPKIFEGWSSERWTKKIVTSATFLDAMDEQPAGSTAITLYANWREDYSIEYFDSDGSAITLPGGAPTRYDYNSYTMLPIPTKAGYEFGGWVETINPTASTPVEKRLGALHTEERSLLTGEPVPASGANGDKKLYALWLSPWSAAESQQVMLAVQTNLEGISGPGYSGSQEGKLRASNKFSGSKGDDPNVPGNGWFIAYTFGQGIYVYYEFYMDRYVTNATLITGLGNEVTTEYTYKYNGDTLDEEGISNLAVIVNGQRIDWGEVKLNQGQFGAATKSGITLIPGKNIIAIQPLEQDSRQSGPLIDYIEVRSMAGIKFTAIANDFT